MAKLIILAILVFFMFGNLASSAAMDKVDGLEYDVRKIDTSALNSFIKKKYDLYELYLENKSSKTFSIPGYSIDFDVDYLTFTEVKSLYKDKSNKKIAFFNVAAGAASLAFGGLPKIAANTAQSVRSFQRRDAGLFGNTFLSENKIYVLYPYDALSLLLFVDKELAQEPLVVRFICRDEENNNNYIVINSNIKATRINAKNNESAGSKEKEGVIASPETNVYK